MSYQDKNITLSYNKSKYSGKMDFSNYDFGHNLNDQMTYFKGIPKHVVLYEESRDLKIQINGEILNLNSRLKDVYAEIKRSQILSKREHDWDENGAIGFIEENYNAAIRFLVLNSNKAFLDYSVEIFAPEIVLARDGSIDLEWRNRNLILVINFRNQGLDGDYYGEDNVNGTIIKGPIQRIEINEDLTHWMRKLI